MYFGYESKSKGIKNVEEWIFFFWDHCWLVLMWKIGCYLIWMKGGSVPDHTTALRCHLP